MIKNMKIILSKIGYRIIRDSRTVSILIKDEDIQYKVMLYINNHGNQVILSEKNLQDIYQKIPHLLEIIHKKPINIMTIIAHCNGKDYVKIKNNSNILQFDNQGHIIKTYFEDCFMKEQKLILPTIELNASMLKSRALNGPKKKVVMAGVSIIICIFLIILHFKGLDSSIYGVSWDNAIKGRIYTIFTYAFLHTNWLHLIGNCLVVLSVGTALEKRIGHFHYLYITFFSLVYAGIATAVFKEIKGEEHILTIGFSGATFALCGALLVYQIFNKERYGWILTYIFFSLISGIMFPNIDNIAHLAGLFSGVSMMIVGLIYQELKKEKQYIKTIKLKCMRL